MSGGGLKQAACRVSERWIERRSSKKQVFSTSFENDGDEFSDIHHTTIIV
jgi:hypothetical protein